MTHNKDKGTNVSYKHWIEEGIDKLKLLTQPEELLPCPFCGGRPEWINLKHPSGIPAIKCHECQFSMQQDRRDKTIFYWNRRQKPDSSLVERCTDC